MNTYFLIDLEYNIYGLYKTEIEAGERLLELSEDCGAMLRECEMIISPSISHSSEDYWDLYLVDMGVRRLLVRAPNSGNAAVDAELYFRMKAAMDPPPFDVYEYTVCPSDFGAAVKLRPKKMLMGEVAERLLAVVTPESRDLAALVIEAAEEAEVYSEKELSTEEWLTNSPALEMDSGESYASFEQLNIDDLRRLTHSVWHSLYSIENAETLEVLSYLGKADKCEDTEELLYMTGILEEHFGYVCSFPYALYTRLIDGRAKEFCADYYRNYRSIFL